MPRTGWISAGEAATKSFGPTADGQAQDKAQAAADRERGSFPQADGRAQGSGPQAGVPALGSGLLEDKGRAIGLGGVRAQDSGLQVATASAILVAGEELPALRLLAVAQASAVVAGAFAPAVVVADSAAAAAEVAAASAVAAADVAVAEVDVVVEAADGARTSR